MNKKRSAVVAALLLVFDQVSKFLFAAADQTVIPGVLGFHAARNRGMAFGLLSGNAGVVLVLGLLALAALFLLLRRRSLSPLSQTGLGLLLGGAAGNLLDRLLYGYVLDFIDVLFVDFFVFNLADIGVTVGAAILALCILLEKDEKNA